jgi:hypothetical protein
MQTWQIVTIAVIAVLVIAGLIWTYRSQQRNRNLRRLAIQRLAETDRERFLTEWKLSQTQFVDDPVRAVYQADRLISEIMRARGFPHSHADARFSDISVAYPRVAVSSREAYAILTRYRRGHASTEDLRRAMVHYRELIDELLGGPHEESKRAA